MTLATPRPLEAEHEELHADLARALDAGGRTGDAARTVADLLHPHFLKEEAYALPPLGLLAQLGQGGSLANVPADASEALAMTERLRAELPEMLAEHARIVAALRALTEAANAEGHPEHARFAEKLILHARTEEEVLYPAALLVGDRLRRDVAWEEGAKGP